MQRTTPNKLDDETLKFIRQKRPRLQCKGSVRSDGGCEFHFNHFLPLNLTAYFHNTHGILC